MIAFSEVVQRQGTKSRVDLGVLLPQQHERDALALQVLVHASPVGLDEARGRTRDGQQGLLQALLVPVAYLVLLRFP